MAGRELSGGYAGRCTRKTVQEERMACAYEVRDVTSGHLDRILPFLPNRHRTGMSPKSVSLVHILFLHAFSTRGEI